MLGAISSWPPGIDINIYFKAAQEALDQSPFLLLPLFLSAHQCAASSSHCLLSQILAVQQGRVTAKGASVLSSPR